MSDKENWCKGSIERELAEERDEARRERDGARRLANEAIEEAAELANVIELAATNCPGEEIGGDRGGSCQGHNHNCVAHWVEIYRGLGRGER